MDKDYVAELKTQLDRAFLVEGDDQKPFHAKIVYRGEGLFYCQDGRAFICDMSVAGDWVSRKSIKKWDDGKKITEGEREVILKNLDKFFRTTQGMTVSFIDK